MEPKLTAPLAEELSSERVTLLEQEANHRNRKDAGIVLNHIGALYREIGNREDAIRAYRQALDIRREINDLDGLAATLHNLGALYLDLEDFEQAHRLLNEAHRVRHDIDDKEGLGRTILCLGRLHETIGDLVEAVACYEQAWELATHPAVDNADDEAAALHNLGGVAIALGDSAYALQMLERAGGILAASDMKAGLATVLYNRGIAHRALGQPQEALSCLAGARAILEQIGDRSGLGATLAATGIVLLERNEPAQAYDALMTAVRLQEELGEYSVQANTLKWLGRVCEKQGCAEEAAHHYRLAAFLSTDVSAASQERASVDTFDTDDAALGTPAEDRHRDVDVASDPISFLSMQPPVRRLH